MTYMNNPNGMITDPGKTLHDSNLRLRNMTPCHKEYSRLLTAAVVNERFRKLLLLDAARALQEGYCEETFHFTPEELQHVISIRASSLPDFAQQLIAQRSPVYQYQSCSSD